jgi:ABC-type lipoprotein release transport system permease subunit
MIVAAFLLLLACINFINLSTANASCRAKEIGIRKTLGSTRKQLIFQFLSETFLLTLSAAVLSVLLTPLLLKIFADFIPKDLHFDLFGQPGIFLFLTILIFVVTLFSGFYPALVLSGYKPVLVLKNQAYSNTGKTRSAWLRKSLTVSQFIIAQIFIMATILVSKQINYSIHKDQGFQKDAILHLSTNFYDTIQGHKYLLADKIKALPGVKLISICTNPPSSNSTWSSTMKYKDGKKEIETNVEQKYGDTNYIKLYGLKLIAGNNLKQSDSVDAFILNETYAHILGFHQPEKLVGKYIEWGNKQIIIKGVVSDFHERSLHEPIKPLVIGSWAKNTRNISIALQPQNESGTSWKNTIGQIEKAWKEVYPKDDFEYHFFDEELAKYYDSEQHISDLLKWATGLAVFISSLGLLGLVIYSTNIRTKEIGIRKVLGASVAQIAVLISWEFIILIAFAFIIAAPVAYIGMYKWLQNFAYHTEISWWIFLLGVSVMIVIALLTLGYQTIRAAKANPVKSLRSE